MGLIYIWLQMKNEVLDLAQIQSEHTGNFSDKWSSYISIYQEVLEPLRCKIGKVLEIGVQNGGSLEIWAKYFTGAKLIVGCDIDPRCASLAFEDPRIQVIVGDVNQSETYRKIIGLSENFDLIIDDGSHNCADVIKTFLIYFSYLAEGGTYIIEDLVTSYWPAYNGGLDEPTSSMNFLKKMADVINYEHWRTDTKIRDFFSQALSSVGMTLPDDFFAGVHSITFMNSLCIIKKAAPEQNLLGPRTVVGNFGPVEPGVVYLDGTDAREIN